MEKLDGIYTADEVAARLVAERLSIEHLRRRSIKIAVPCYRDVSPWHLLSMVHMTAVLNALGVGYGLYTVQGMPVCDARNALANRLFESPHTDILFIDADMSWQPWDAIRLIASGLQLVAAVGKKKSAAPDSDLSTWCARPSVVDGRVAITDAGFVEVEYVGTGMMLINESVLRKMAAAHPEWRRDTLGGQHEEFFEFFATDLSPDGTHRLGEDISFCKRWQALGGKVFVDPMAKLGHHGIFNYTGNFAQFFDHPAIIAA